MYHLGINEKRFVVFLQIENFFWIRFIGKIAELKQDWKVGFRGEMNGQADITRLKYITKWRPVTI